MTLPGPIQMLPIPNVAPRGQAAPVPGIADAAAPGLSALANVLALRQRKAELDQQAQELQFRIESRRMESEANEQVGLGMQKNLVPLLTDTQGFAGPLVSVPTGMGGSTSFQAPKATVSQLGASIRDTDPAVLGRAAPYLQGAVASELRRRGEAATPRDRNSELKVVNGFWWNFDLNTGVGDTVKDKAGNPIPADKPPVQRGGLRPLGSYTRDGKEYVSFAEMDANGNPVIRNLPVGQGFVKSGVAGLENEKAAGRYLELADAWQQIRTLPAMGKGAVDFVLSLQKLPVSDKARPIGQLLAESNLSEADKQILNAYAAVIVAKRNYKDSGAAVTGREILNSINLIPLYSDGPQTLSNKRRTVLLGIMDDFYRGQKILESRGMPYQPVDALMEDYNAALDPANLDPERQEFLRQRGQ